MFKFRLNLNRPSKRLASKEDYLAKWTAESERGRALEAVTREAGYKVAAEHFENIINALIRDENGVRTQADVREYIKGVEAVFAYFESGVRVAEAAEETMRKYENAE